MLKGMINNFSIKIKIMFLLGIIFSLLGVYSVFQYLEIQALNEETDSKNIDLSFLEARKGEKDFLAGKNLNDAEKVNSTINKLDSLLQPYLREETAIKINEAVGSYKSIFDDLVILIKERGIDENSGAEGKLRESIHNLESLINEDSDKNVLVKMLMARRHEKDFFLREDAKYISELKESVASLKLKAQNLNISAQEKTRISNLIDDYVRNFEIASKCIFDVKKTNASLNKQAAEIESLIDKMFEAKQEAASDAYKIKFAIMIFVFIAALLSGLYIIKLITNPIHKLTEAANKMASGELDIEVDINSNDEVGKLAASFNSMSQKISLQVQYLENLPSPVVIIDKEFSIQYLNKSASQVIGKEAAVLLGQKCYDQFKTCHCQTNECALNKAMENDGVFAAETVAKPNGKEMPIIYTGAPVKNKKGEIIGAMEAVADISEIKEMQNYLTRSTQKMLSAMDQFAEGDLTVEVVPEKENDDLGKLFKGFNKSIKNVRNAIEQVNGAVQAVASASTQISSSSEEMAAGASEQSSQTSEVASAVEEMTRTILETSKNTIKAADNSKNANAMAKKGVSKIDKTNSGMKKIVDSAMEAGKLIAELAQKTEQIGEITQVIDDIADQTNLLALNAAIEAARAGEQGRGFAVVADEVRKLAERTTKATKEISNMIKEVQTEAKAADSSMSEAGKSVEEGMSLTAEVADVLHEILLVNSKVSDMVNQIATAGEEQSATAEQISKNIEGISCVTDQSAAGTLQIARAAEDLNQLTNNLQLLVERFKLKNESKYSVRANGVLVNEF